MNDYAQRLAELQQQPDHELKQIGDQWQTPKELAMGLFWHFTPKIGPIVLDLFADECNALCAEFYTSSDNALTQEWANDLRQLGGAAFANPPYSRPQSDSDGTPITGIENILAYCREQRELGAKIMLLLKAGTSEGWWPEDADFIQFVSGRIGFKTPNWYVPRDPKKDKPSSSGFASAVVIFDKDWKWERRPIERLNRNDLETQGRMIMNMIERRATVIAESMLPAVAAIEPPVTTEHTHIEESDCKLAEVADDNYLLDLEAPEEPELTYADKTLDELELEFKSGSLACNSWNRFVVETAILFSYPTALTHRQVMFALTSIDSEGDMTNVSEDEKNLIKTLTTAINETERSLNMTNEQRYKAVFTLHDRIRDGESPLLFEQIKIMRNAVMGNAEEHQAVTVEHDPNSFPEGTSELKEHLGTGEEMKAVQSQVLTSSFDVSEGRSQFELAGWDGGVLQQEEPTDSALSAEWLREQYMKLDAFDELMDSIKQEVIEKTIDAVGYINEEFANNELAPKAEDVIDGFFASNPNVRTYMNSRSLRATFRSLVHTSMKEVANV